MEGLQVKSMQNIGGKQENLNWFCKAPMCMHLQQVGFWHH